MVEARLGSVGGGLVLVTDSPRGRRRTRSRQLLGHQGPQAAAGPGHGIGRSWLPHPAGQAEAAVRGMPSPCQAQTHPRPVAARPCPGLEQPTRLRMPRTLPTGLGTLVCGARTLAATCGRRDGVEVEYGSFGQTSLKCGYSLSPSFFSSSTLRPGAPPEPSNSLRHAQGGPSWPGRGPALGGAVRRAVGEATFSRLAMAIVGTSVSSKAELSLTDCQSVALAEPGRVSKRNWSCENQQRRGCAGQRDSTSKGPGAPV